jgi:uncharacterized membrane protein
VTRLGSAAGVAGATLLGSVAWFLGAPPTVAVWSAIGGIVGTLTDSCLGSTLQARYRCDQCRGELERAAHPCTGTARLSGGLRWIDNDVVNAVATLMGGSVAALGVALFP